jgi:predicted nucleic acid-binding protein
VTAIVAFLDASVLYPATVRSILIRLAIARMYRALWSDAVQDEWINALLRDSPHLSRDRLMRTRQLMDTHVRAATVTGYEPLVETLHLPDANDRHVLAAAIHGGASLIVTANLRDFPDTALAVHGLQAIHPDTFILSRLEAAPDTAIAALAADRASLRHPPCSPDAYLQTLRACQLPAVADALHAHRDHL